MPTTLTGLLLAVALLLPGITFVSILERDTPRQSRSPFRESAIVITVSALAFIAVFVIFLVLRWGLPQSAQVIDDLIRLGWNRVRDNYMPLAIWSLGALALGIGLAAAAACIVGLKSPHPSTKSAWWMLFDHWHQGHDKHVGCRLEDGAWIEGKLETFNNASEDIADREFILTAPIKYADNKDHDAEPYSANAVCISAHRVVAMFVSYMPRGYADPEPISASSGSTMAAEEESSSESSQVPRAGQ